MRPAPDWSGSISNPFRPIASGRRKSRRRLTNWHVFELRFNGDRDGLVEHLEKRDIQANAYYVVPHHLQPALAYLGYRKGSLPHTEKLCAEAIALPLYPEMPGSVIDTVVRAIRQFPVSCEATA